MHFSKKDIFAIPNILTYVRILLVPVFVVVYMNAQSLSGHIWSIVIVAISALIFDNENNSLFGAVDQEELNQIGGIG